VNPVDAERWRRLRQVVEELSDLAPAAREERLRALEPELATEARALLAAAESDTASQRIDQVVAARAARVLDSEAEGGTDDRDAAADLTGVELGPWRLERLLGRGGMAEVWEARRVDGKFEQTVAVKLLKRGMDSQEILRRFLRERQILARLDHPRIARLYDGGVAPDGRPYLVLERVDGEPITDWCARRELGVEERLRLLLACCDAVAAAHRQLVVHRDLKPSNILVTREGDVKLLDFGIAKLLEEEGGDETRADVRVLTPSYAAPEQIMGEPVSTATDVYALGVLGYELLTGRLPHRRAGSRAADLASAVASESIARPSTAVLDADAATTTAPPGKPQQLARSLRGDLDAVLLQALRREPARRYASVAAFADDLERHLEGRPVSARPDSVGYRAGKFVRRHRLAVAAATIAVLALAAVTAFALLQAQRASREAARARSEARRAEAQAQRAEQQAARAERVKSFLASVFAVSDPLLARGEQVTARALLDEGVRRVDGELAREPGLHGEMLDLLAGLYRKLGDLPVARSLAERALALRSAQYGVESAEAAKSEWTLGWVLSMQGEYKESRRRLDHAIAVLDRVEGPDSLAAADAREPLMELVFSGEGPQAALPVVERRLATYQRVLGDSEPRTALAYSDLGVVFENTNRPKESEAALRKAIALLEPLLPPDDPRLAYPHNNLAGLLIDVDRAAEAETEVRRAIDIRTKALGPAHQETIGSRGLLTIVLMHLDRLEEAESNQRATLADSEKAGDRYASAQLRTQLATLLMRREQFPAALTEFDRALAVHRGLFPPTHILVLITRINRADLLVRMGRKAEAAAELHALDAELVKKGPEGQHQLDRVHQLEKKIAA